MQSLKLLLVLLFSLPAWAAIETYQFSSPQQEETYQQLTQQLRCPQCQNNNIADSNATISADMREKTLELLKQGKTKQEVVNYMIERYGNFVTYDPPLTPATVLLWLTPLFLILIGFVLLAKRKKQHQQAVSSAQNSAKELDQYRLHRILNEKDEQL